VNSTHTLEKVDGTGDSFPVTVWTHVAFTCDGTTVRYFQDGVLENFYQNVAPAARTLSRVVLGLGAVSSHPTMHGQMDDFRVYAGAMSATQMERVRADMAPASTMTIRNPGDVVPSVYSDTYKYVIKELGDINGTQSAVTAGLVANTTSKYMELTIRQGLQENINITTRSLPFKGNARFKYDYMINNANNSNNKRDGFFLYSLDGIKYLYFYTSYESNQVLFNNGVVNTVLGAATSIATVLCTYEFVVTNYTSVTYSVNNKSTGAVLSTGTLALTGWESTPFVYMSFSFGHNTFPNNSFTQAGMRTMGNFVFET
jgi:hypothetical protein